MVAVSDVYVESFFMTSSMELVRVRVVDSNQETAQVEVWKATTVPDLSGGAATTRTTEMVSDWASDLHYFEVNNPLTVVPCDELLALVCTVPVQRMLDRWCVRISTVGARCVLRIVPSVEAVSPSLSANGPERASCVEEAVEVVLERTSQSKSDDMEDGGLDLVDLGFDEMQRKFLQPGVLIDETGASIQVTTATWGLRIDHSSIKALGIFTDDNYQGPLRIFPLLGRIVAVAPPGALSRRMSLHDRQRAYDLPGDVCEVYLPSCAHGPHPPSTGPAPLTRGVNLTRVHIFAGARVVGSDSAVSYGDGVYNAASMCGFMNECGDPNWRFAGHIHISRDVRPLTLSTFSMQDLSSIPRRDLPAAGGTDHPLRSRIPS